MNVRDSEQVARMFADRGYTLTANETEADVILINTCSVRDQAEQKALGKMGHMGRYRRDRPHLVYGFLGCMAQSRGEELLTDVPHTDLVVGTQKYHKVVDHVDEIWRAKTEKDMDDLRRSIVDIDEETDSQNTIRDHFPDHRAVTAFVSIMQGCNMKCTFCIVPFTRGPERARPIPEIVDEVKILRDRGVKEVTLLGQIVNLYGRHEFPAVDGRSPFVQLLEAVHDVDGIERIRFTSPHPIGYKKDLVDAFTYLPKLASHVHFPLQSGSDRILKRMHRPYKAAKFIEICDQMREARPHLSITTDIIVGFPGETEEDYAQTKAVVARADFDNAFVFRYSRRRDTPAAEMDGQLSERVKEERNQDLLKCVGEQAARKNLELVGTEVEILCEGPSKTNAQRLMGRTSANKIVVFEGRTDRHVGEMFPVHIERSTGFTLYGTPALAASLV